MKKRLAILASHNGSVIEPIIKAIDNQTLNIEIALIITNNSNANVLNKANRYKIDSFIVNSKLYDDVDEEIMKLSHKYKVDMILLAGYMKYLSPKLVESFNIINSHPSLLPLYGGEGMYGRYVHEAVISNGEKKSGVTVHEVTTNYDEGRIIVQKSLELKDGETAHSLETRVKSLEGITVVEALMLCLNKT